jgi:hypothetical protein
MSGKGSKPRPFSVDQKTFNDNWEVIFVKNKNSIPVENKEVRSDKTITQWDHYSDLPSVDSYR